MAPLLDRVVGDQASLLGLNVLLQVTVVAAVTLVAARFLRRRLAARHALYRLSLLLLLPTPAIALLIQSSNHALVAVSLSGRPPTDSQQKDASFAPTTAPREQHPPQHPIVASTAATALQPHVPEHSLPNALARSNLQNKDSRSASPAVSSEATQSIAAAAPGNPESSPPANATGVLLQRIMPGVVCIWIVGSMVLLARAAAGWRRLAKVLQTARPISGDSFRECVAAALRSLGVEEAPPMLMKSSRVTSPLAAGIWRPRVILPESIEQQVSAEQFRQILVHEMAHVARRDPTFALLQNAVACLFWLHPLVHVLNRGLARAREEVCDNHVLATTDAPSYSRTLLILAEHSSMVRPLPGTVPLFTSRWRLESRIAGILDERRDLATRLTVRGKALLAATALLAAFGAASGTIAQTPARVALANERNDAPGTEPIGAGSMGTGSMGTESIGPASMGEASTEAKFDPTEVVHEAVDQLNLRSASDQTDFDSQRSTVVPRDGGGDAKPDSVRDAETKAKIAILDQVAADAKASYERIRTWTGAGEYRASLTWESGARPYKQVARRQADIRFAIDQKAKSLFVAWDEREPIRLTDAEHSPGRLLTTDVNHFHSILTPDSWLDFRTARRFTTRERPLFGFDGSLEPQMLVIRSPFDANHLRFEAEGLIDPRVWTSVEGRYMRSDHRFFWDEIRWLKEFYAERKRAGKPVRAFDNFDVIREERPTGTVVLVRTYWGWNGKPDRNDPRTLRRELEFEPRYGYAMTRQENSFAGNHERVVVGYVKKGPIAVPARLTRTVSDKQRQTEERLDIRLTESRINEPLDRSRFAMESLHLHDGDLVLDEFQDRTFRIEQGKRMPFGQPSGSKRDMSPRVSTSLSKNVSVSLEWNDLVHRYVNLSNNWRHAEPERLPPAERKRVYAQNREAWENLARRYFALHPLQEERRPNPLEGLNCLGEIVCMEYAGHVADEAAAILLEDHSLAKAPPFFAQMLGYSLPASLAAETVLRGMLKQSESRASQAQARMSLARFLVTQSERAALVKAVPSRAEQVAEEYGDWYLDRLRKIDPSRAQQEAQALWKDVIDNFADVADVSDKEKLADQAGRDLRRLHHTVGRKAPEIAGNDFDDQPMKLSDTNGKVRVLLFWGNWCRPCRRHYPHLRQLMAKYAKEPFAVLGVCSDKRKDDVRHAVVDGSITWRFWWDGDPDRWKIHREWSLFGSPWFFVLDRKGIVRFAEIDAEDLDAAVEMLLKENTGSTK